MTEFERRICELKADLNSINVRKEKARKIHEDLVNQVNILDLLIAFKLTRGESISEYLSKKEDLKKEIEANNDRLEDILYDLKENLLKTAKLLEDMIF